MTAATQTLRNGVDTAALAQTIGAVKDNPDLAKVTFAVDSQWLTGCHQRAHTGPLRQNGAEVPSGRAGYVLDSDEPVALLGSDRAASPGEYVLQALAGCYAVSFATHAAKRGIELDSLRLELEVDFDLQGFLEVDDTVRPGAQEIRVVVHATSSNADDAQLRHLTDVVQRRSPIRDTLASPVRVVTTLAG